MASKKSALFAGGALLAAAAAYGFARKRTSGLPTVDSVDLSRFLGRWFEIARIPNRFEKNCIGDTTATYTRADAGTIAVVNSCRRPDGGLEEVKGTARVVDTATNAKLKVTFLWPFTGDYWIIGLDADYRWAVVGEPRRRFLWVFSREARMSDFDYNHAVRIAGEKGYNTAKLKMTLQRDAR